MLIVAVEVVSCEENDSYAVFKRVFHQRNQLILRSFLPCANHFLCLLQCYHYNLIMYPISVPCIEVQPLLANPLTSDLLAIHK